MPSESIIFGWIFAALAAVFLIGAIALFTRTAPLGQRHSSSIRRKVVIVVIVVAVLLALMALVNFMDLSGYLSGALLLMLVGTLLFSRRLVR